MIYMTHIHDAYGTYLYICTTDMLYTYIYVQQIRYMHGIYDTYSTYLYVCTTDMLYTHIRTTDTLYA